MVKTAIIYPSSSKTYVAYTVKERTEKGEFCLNCPFLTFDLHMLSKSCSVLLQTGITGKMIDIVISYTSSNIYTASYR